MPYDDSRILFPQLQSTIIYLVLLWIAKHFEHGYLDLAGFLAGYVIYDLTHYYLHFGNPREGSYFHNLKRNHIAHHFNEYDKGSFGNLVNQSFDNFLIFQGLAFHL